MKKYFLKIIMLILSFSIILTFAACKVVTGTPAPDFPYKDMIERPSDIPPLSYKNYVKYPEKPANMSAGQGSGMPTIGTVSTTSEYYKVEQANGKITVKFNEVADWDYIIIPINNFNKEYQNIKLTATGTNISNVSASALYYEMYERNLPAVTTLIQGVGDTEQYYFMELGKDKLVDASYHTLPENLGDQTVFAICLFVDSNPSLLSPIKNTEKESVFEISAIEFLKDGDPSIKDKYVEPSLNVGYFDASYDAVKDDETKEYTITKSSTAALYENASLNVSNYSSDYSAFNMKFDTTGIKNLTVELTFTGGLANWADSVLVYKATNLEDGEHEAYIDFSSAQPNDKVTWEIVYGYFVKNYRVTGIRFFLDTIDGELNENEGVLHISEINFERTVVETDTTISKGWSAGSSNITLGDDIAAGGIGSVSFNWYSTWEYLAIPVLNYNPSNKLVIEFQAEQGIDFMGIALGGASFPQGETVIKSCWDKIDVVGDKEMDVDGMVETIEYDETTKIYKITFDFTNAAKVDRYEGKGVNEMNITSLRFYFTDPDSVAEFDGTRTVRFISISFE